MFFLSYFDETGDDGANCSSSELFILTSVYMPYTSWKDNFQKTRDFRRRLNTEDQLPTRTEIHTKDLLANKWPYARYHWAEKKRLGILEKFIRHISILDVKVISIVINKARCTLPVLDQAVTFNVQRIENDLSEDGNPHHCFLLITDQGRLEPMVKVCRKIQVTNPVPSKNNGGPLHSPNQFLLEDPLEKDSRQSYFLQMSDAISFVVYMYCMREILGKEFHHRIARFVDRSTVENMLQTLQPVLNTKASPHPNCKYGIKIYPQ